MSDPRRERLFQELWPTPEPPADLAARVTGTLAADAEARRAKLPRAPTSVPAAKPRRRRAAFIAIAASVTVAAAGLALFLGTPTDAELAGPAEGALVARAHETVQIGNRGAAAMEPGADVTWSVRGKRARIKQRRGSVFYRVERGGPFRVSTPAGDIEVTGTSFRVTLGGAATGPAASTVVSVLEGSVKVETDRGMLAIRAGETALLAPGRLPEITTTAASGPPVAPDDALRERAESAEARLRELEAEMAASARDGRHSRRAPLLLPFARDLAVYGSGLDEVSLALPAGRRAARVEVARDAGFSRTVYTGPAEGFVTVRAPAKGALYWRVAGQPGAVAEAHFGPDPGGLAATARRRADHLVTEGRESTTVYFQGAPPALTLAFTADPADPAAARHRVRIYRAGALGRPVFDRVVSGERVEVEAGVLGEGRYVWSALPLDDRGRPQGGGRFNKLELVYDNALSGLAIAAPRPDQMTVPARPLEVIGVAPLGARLHVNGRPTPLDDKGRFALRLPSPPRLLVFRLERKGGGESYWIRPLRRR